MVSKQHEERQADGVNGGLANASRVHRGWFAAIVLGQGYAADNGRWPMAPVALQGIPRRAEGREKTVRWWYAGGALLMRR